MKSCPLRRCLRNSVVQHRHDRVRAERGFGLATGRLYYLHEDSERVNEIRFLDLSTGANTLLGRIDKPLTGGLTVSQDGPSLVYAGLQRRGNIFIAENPHPRGVPAR